MKLSRCPYCGRRIKYFTALLHKDKGEYTCNRCDRESEVEIIKKPFYLLFTFSALISIIILVLLILFMKKKSLWGVFAVGLPLFIFYLISPTFLSLVPLKKYRQNVMGQGKGRKIRDVQENRQRYNKPPVERYGTGRPEIRRNDLERYRSRENLKTYGNERSEIGRTNFERYGRQEEIERPVQNLNTGFAQRARRIENERIVNLNKNNERIVGNKKAIDEDVFKNIKRQRNIEEENTEKTYRSSNNIKKEVELDNEEFFKKYR